MSAGKPLRYTRHALDALAERELRTEWVELAARQPEWREPDPDDDVVERRFLTIPERGDRILRVAVVETPKEIRILTAFLDRRARRPA